jgi:hypothetical protein
VLTTSEVQSHYNDPANVASSSPLSFWRLDEASPVQAAADQQGLHPGSYAGAPTVAEPGVAGTAMKVVEETMTVPNSTDFDDGTTFSFELWVKPIGSVGSYWQFQTLACNRSTSTGWLLATNTSGGLRFQNGDGSQGLITSTTSLTSGVWNQVVAVTDHGAMRLYLNGSLLVSGTGTSAPSSQPLKLGAYCTGTNPAFGFSFDEASVYQRVLSLSEIKAQYKDPPNLAQSYGSCDGAGAHGLSASECLSDPVNTLSGAYTASVTDATLPGRGLSLDFTRSYTSADSTSGRLGPGWTDSYWASLAIQTNGDALLHGEDGQRLYYTKQPDGSFTGPPGALSA